MAFDVLSFLIGQQTAKASGGGSVEGVHFVTFMNEDGTQELYKRPVADGDDCADPVKRGLIDEPTKESTVQYNYTHVGWSASPNGALDENILKAVTADKTVYANFAAVIRYYTVTYYDDDGTTELKTESLAYGTTPSYKPTKDDYDFVAWTPNTAVTGDMSYTASWKEKAAFETSSWADIISVAQSGNAASTFAVGDERTETITYADGTSEQITWVIASLNQVCDIEEGGKDNVTIVAKHALGTKQKVRSTMSGSFEGSALDTYLNGSFFDALPEDLQNGIKAVHTNYTTWAARKIWIPSLKQLGLTATNYGSGFCGNDEFEYFDTAEKRIMKQGADGTATIYWTRSTNSSGNYTYYACVNENGDNYVTKLPNETQAVVPCFCI